MIINCKKQTNCNCIVYCIILEENWHWVFLLEPGRCVKKTKKKNRKECASKWGKHNYEAKEGCACVMGTSRFGRASCYHVFITVTSDYHRVSSDTVVGGWTVNNTAHFDNIKSQWVTRVIFLPLLWIPRERRTLPITIKTYCSLYRKEIAECKHIEWLLLKNAHKQSKLDLIVWKISSKQSFKRRLNVLRWRDQYNCHI